MFRTYAVFICLVAALGVPGPSSAQRVDRLAVEFQMDEADLQLLSKRGAISFIVGYFPESAKGTEPLFSYTTRSARLVTGGRIRITLRGWDAPADVQHVLVRLKAVTAGGHSAWSDPSGRIAVPALEALLSARSASRTNRPAARRANDAAAARVADQLRANSALTSALAKRFPGVRIAEVAEGYPSLQNFIAALFAASSLDIPWAELKPLTMTRQKGSLEAALRKLRPDVDARAEARKAFAEAAEMLKSTRRRPAKVRSDALIVREVGASAWKQEGL